MHGQRHASLAALFVLFVAPLAGADEDTGFESAPAVTASQLLSAEQNKGPDHTVAEAVQTARFMHVFRVESTYGRYEAGSRRMLEIRLREVETMSKVVGMEGGPEFLRSLGGRLAQIPTAAVEILVNPKDSFEKMGDEIERSFERFKDLFKRRSGTQAEDSKAHEALTGVEKRKLAAELGLDVYSTNPKVQSFLNDIAAARTAGSAGIDLASFALPIVGYLAVSTARLRADVNRLLRDKTPAELERHNETVLRDAGVPADVRATFLRKAWLSPRHQTVITAGFRELEGVEGRTAIPRAAGLARTEVGALYHEQQALLLAHFHADVERVAKLDAVRHVVVGRTVANGLVVLVPADQVYWTQDFERLVNDVLARPLAEGVTRRQLLVTGRVTERARANLERVGFDVTDRYAPATPDK